MMGLVNKARSWICHLLSRVNEPWYTFLTRAINFYLRFRIPESVRHLGPLHPDKTFYIITDFGTWTGIAGWYDRVLGYLAHAEKRGYTPVILHEPDPEDSVEGGRGNWLTYFKPPSPYALGEVFHSGRVVFATMQAMIYKRLNKKNIQLRHRLSQMVPFNEETEKFIVEHFSVLSSNWESPMIGAYFRGTDYRRTEKYVPTGHAVIPSYEQFVSSLREDCLRWNIPVEDGRHFFFVTEEQEALDFLLKEFPNAHYVKKERFSHFEPGGTVKLAYAALPHTTPRVNNLFYLLDLYALSKCDYLVGPMNGGIQMALNWNGNHYADVHIIDLGTY